MLLFQSVTDHSRILGAKLFLMADVTLEVPPDRYAIVLDNPDMMRSMVNLVGGLRRPKFGHILHGGSVSWPIGRMSLFRAQLTGRQMIGIVAKLYGLRAAPSEEFVVELIGVPELLTETGVHWPPFLKRDFILALGLLPRFDVYIIQGGLPAPGLRFGSAWHSLFEQRIRSKLVLMSSLSAPELLGFCNRALLRVERKLLIDDDLKTALDRYPPKISQFTEAEDQPAGDPETDF